MPVKFHDPVHVHHLHLSRQVFNVCDISVLNLKLTHVVRAGGIDHAAQSLARFAHCRVGSALQNDIGDGS